MTLFPFRDKQQDPPVTHCNVCGAEIYRYSYCELDGCMVLCETCAEERPDDYFYRSRMTGEEFDNYLMRLYGGDQHG